MKKSIGIVAAGLSALLCGCHTLNSCDAPPLSGTGDTIPPLRIPAGMEKPDMRNALRIPELNEPEKPEVAARRCLDTPPAYGVHIAVPPPKEKKRKKGGKDAPPAPPAAAGKGDPAAT